MALKPLEEALEKAERNLERERDPGPLETVVSGFQTHGRFLPRLVISRLVSVKEKEHV